MYTLCAEKCEDRVNEFLCLYASKKIHNTQYQMFHKEATVELILNIQKTLLKQDVIVRFGKRQGISQKEWEQLEAIFIKNWYHVKERVKEKIEYHLKEEEEFHLYGFYRFRLKEETKEMGERMQKEIEDLQIVGYETVESLQKLLLEQQPMEKQVEVHIENGLVRITGRKGTYMEEKIHSSSYDTEDELIAKLVMISARFVMIYDEENVLSKQTVVLLTKLFGTNIKFQ